MINATSWAIYRRSPIRHTTGILGPPTTPSPQHHRESRGKRIINNNLDNIYHIPHRTTSRAAYIGTLSIPTRLFFLSAKSTSHLTSRWPPITHTRSHSRRLGYPVLPRPPRRGLLLKHRLRVYLPLLRYRMSLHLQHRRLRRSLYQGGNTLRQAGTSFTIPIR